MLEYVNQLWQTFLNGPHFWAVRKHYSCDCFCDLGARFDGSMKNGSYPITFWVLILFAWCCMDCG